MTIFIIQMVFLSMNCCGIWRIFISFSICFAPVFDQKFDWRREWTFLIPSRNQAFHTTLWILKHYYGTLNFWSLLYESQNTILPIVTLLPAQHDIFQTGCFIIMARHQQPALRTLLIIFHHCQSPIFRIGWLIVTSNHQNHVLRRNITSLRFIIPLSLERNDSDISPETPPPI